MTVKGPQTKMWGMQISTFAWCGTHAAAASSNHVSFTMSDTSFFNSDVLLFASFRQQAAWATPTHSSFPQDIAADCTANGTVTISYASTSLARVVQWMAIGGPGYRP